MIGTGGYLDNLMVCQLVNHSHVMVSVLRMMAK